MKQFTAAELDQIIDSGETVIIDFFATWCGPCKMLAPIFESAAGKAEGRAVFAKVDTDQEPGLVARYGIQSVPTIIMIKNGETAFRASGVMNEGALLALLDQ